MFLDVYHSPLDRYLSQVEPGRHVGAGVLVGVVSLRRIPSQSLRTETLEDLETRLGAWPSPLQVWSLT